MTFANWLTVGRILLVPFFIISLVYYRPGFEVYRIVAFWIFAFAAVTDAVDGFIARRWNQVSKLGTLIDPVADKCLVVSGFLAIALSPAFTLKPPVWIVIVILSREVIILFALFIVTLIGSKISFEPNFLGKVTTVSQMLTLASLLLVLPTSPFLWYISAILTIISGIFYVVRGGKRLNGLTQQ